METKNSTRIRLAKQYRKLSLLGAAILIALILILALLKRLYIGLILGSFAIAVEGLVLYKIGYLVPLRTGRRSRPYTKTDLIMYLTLSLLLLILSLATSGKF